MTALDVARMRVRYRLPAADPALRRRLDAVLERVLDDALEPALVRRGVPTDEEICVRSVRVPVQVRLGAGEVGASDTWSVAIADAIAAAVVTNGADVARYRSRHVALADLALGVADGRLERVWAWRRLGLWRGPDAPDERGRAQELALALVSEPTSVVAVLAHVARAGALPELVRIVAREEWLALARTATGAAGASERIVDAAVEHVLARSPLSDQAAEAWLPLGARGSQPQSQAVDVAARVVHASVLARAVAGPLPDETAVALAVLAWLESDPAAVAATSVRSAVDVVGEIAGRLAPTVLVDDRPDPGSVAARTGAGVERTVIAEEESQPAGAAEEELPVEVVHAPTSGALTKYGGLLFLLGVLDELDIPAVACRTVPLARRPLRWTLHRLALMLVPAAADDPAVLAFAGLPPDAEPPGDDGRPQTDAEQIALDLFRSRIEDRLGARLAQAESPTDDLLDFVCRRTAEIVFDPAWLEVHLPLDEVSVELRRAAIDLDPDWLPWFGAVVRFVYG